MKSGHSIYSDHSKGYRNYRHLSKKTRDGSPRSRRGKEGRPFKDEDHSPDHDEELVLFNHPEKGRGFFHWTVWMDEKTKRFYCYYDDDDDEEESYYHAPPPPQRKPDYEEELLKKKSAIMNQLDKNRRDEQELEKKLDQVEYDLEVHRITELYGKSYSSDDDEW